MPKLLASLEDFAAVRGVTYDPTDLQAIIALEGASGLVRAYCDRDFTYVEDDEIIVFPHGTEGLLLPEPPAYDVSAVTLIDSDGEETELEVGDWFLDSDPAILYRAGGSAAGWYWNGWWWHNAPPSRVGVTYSHGYVMPGEDEIDGVQDLPPELVLTVLSIAARNKVIVPSGGQSVRTKKVGTFEVGYGDQSTVVDELGITAAERQVLERYRIKATP